MRETEISNAVSFLTLACVRKLTAFEISVSRIAVVVARGLRSAVVDRRVGPTPGVDDTRLNRTHGR